MSDTPSVLMSSPALNDQNSQGIAQIPSDLAAREIPLTENARTVLKKRYLRKDADGKPVETIPEMFWRVAWHVAQPDAEAGADVYATARRFYDLLTNLKFMPNSPTFTGAGTPLGQLAACFVLKIEDDMGKVRGGIFDTLRDAALIQQTGGGNGFSFSRLRPKGAYVHTSAGTATGPVGFLRVYDKAFGEIAQGGCLLPETLVFTARGLLRLDEIVDPKTPGWQSHSLEVATDDGWRPSPRGYNNGVAPVLRLHTYEGLGLAGTPEHRVKVMTAAGPEWRHLQEVRAGDWILVQLGQHRGTLQALRHPRRQHGNQSWPALPSVLDEELAFFLGYLTGDGFIASRPEDYRVGVSVAHTSYLVAEMPELMQRLFGVTVHRQQTRADRSVTFVIDNRAVKEFLQLNGLQKARSHDASVPRLIRQSPPEVVGAYLRGLLEADGTLSHGYPALTTTSPRLAEEVATLLIGLGCPVRVRSMGPGVNRWGSAQVYQVGIHSTVGLQAWRERIGCDRRSRFVVAYAWESDQRRESSYRLPSPEYWLRPVLDTITLEQIDARGGGMGRKFRSRSPRLRRALLRYLRGDRQFTRSAYEKLSRTSPEFAASAPPLKDWWFVQVSGVEPVGEALTLDLEVDENHTYLAYGMVTHNTRRGANMAVLRIDHPDIREFIRCKAEEGEISNFNISVGITDEFMQAVERGTTFDLRFGGKVHETVDARELFNEIVRYAYRNGEPGVLFLDAANRSNPLPHLYELEATNPCITGDTLVATPQGWRRVDSIREGDEICTVLGTGRVSTIEVNHNMPVYRVYLSDGATVRATAAHQFHVRDSRRKFFEPRRLDELKPGDWVRVYRSTLPNNPVPPTSADLSDREYGFLVGVLVGDGCYTPHALSKNVVRVSTHADDHEWNDVLHRAFAKVGVEKMYTYVNEGSRSMMMDPQSGRIIADWVKSLPLEAARGPEKRLPECYINSNRDFLTGLLDGLFSTDGNVDLYSNRPLLRFHTSSQELAQQVRRILLMFGVHARIAKSQRKRHDLNGRVIRHDRPKYDVVISGTSLGRFFEQIHLSHPDKQMKLEEAALRSNFTGGNWAARVIKIEPAGVETVYDLYEPRSDTWITEGYVSRGCGEQWLGPYENCCLGSVNLARHVSDDGVIDWEALAETVRISTHFLDNVVSANAYVPAVPELKEAANRARRIGLGIMGLGDVMFKLGVRYGSVEGQELAAQLMEFVRYHCMQHSIELARERGPFPAIKGSIYDPANLKWRPPMPLFAYEHDWGRPPLDWSAIVAGIKRHGIRNAAQTTVAPTGTISTVAGVEGYGCEPVFALAYLRWVQDGDNRLQLTYTSPLFERALIEAGLDEATRQQISEKVSLTGSCQELTELPEDIRHTFVVAGDITPEEHVRMQASIQAFVDNSLSKCVTGDTLVLTTQGLVPIASLAEMRLPDQFAAHDLTIVSPHGPEASDFFYYGGMRETRRVRLEYGYEIEGTPNHRIHVLGPDGHIRFTTLDELKIGDTIVLYAGQQVFGPAGQPLPAYRGEWRTNVKEIRFPESMSPELAYVLGAITSEGSIGRNGVQICNGDRTLLERLGILFQQLFGLESHISRDRRRESVFTLQINSRPLRHWLLAELGMEASARHKVIPDCILRAARHEIAAFLRGLFLDAFMTLDGRMFGITLASRTLIRQLQTLLLNFGVFTPMHRSSEHAWSLTAHGQALEQLASFVEFDEVWKSERIQAHHDGRVQRFFNYGTLLPKSVTQTLRAMHQESKRPLRSLYGEQTPEYQRARVNLRQGHHLERGLAQRLHQHFSDAPQPYAQAFFASDREGMIYVTVKGIAAGFTEVFDISVPGSHSFIANGLCNHNTINFPTTATAEDVATAYKLAWKLNCKGITVYVTGTRETVVLETKETAQAKQGSAPTGSPATRPPAQAPAEYHSGKKPRPRRLAGATYFIRTPLGKAYITINRNGDGEPFEVFATVSKAGSDTAAVADAIGRLISLVLRLPSSLSPTERLEEVVEQLSGIGGGRHLGFGANRILSLPDAIAQVLQEDLHLHQEGAEAPPEPVEPRARQLDLLSGTLNADLCPECGHASLVNEEGCRKCYSCAYSEC